MPYELTAFLNWIASADIRLTAVLTIACLFSLYYNHVCAMRED